MRVQLNRSFFYRLGLSVIFALVVVTAAIVAPLPIGYPPEPHTHAEPQLQPGLVDGFYRVERVVDGDTIIIDNVGRLRFRHFDAPEMDEPGGPELKQRLADMAKGSAVYVRFARNRHGQPVRDRYGRLLADVFIQEREVLR